MTDLKVGRVTFQQVNEINRVLSRSDYVQEQQHKTWKKLGNGQTEKEKARKQIVIDMIMNFCKTAGGPIYNHALVVGCRNGYEMHLLKCSGFTRVSNIDLYSRNKNIIKMDMQDLGFKNDTFGLILSIHSLEHSLDPIKTLQEFRRVSIHRGVVAIEIPINFKTGGTDLWDFGSEFDPETILGCKQYYKEVREKNDFFNKTNNPIMRFIGIVNKE